MLNPSAPGQAVPENQQPKQMLTWTTNASGQKEVRINYSSLDLISTCLRKAHYSLNLNLRKTEEAAALAFGTSIHKALEHWYQLPVEERLLPKSLEEQAELYAFGQDLEQPAAQGALEAVRLFAKARYPVLSSLPETDKRSLASGVRILKAYFKHYANDGFVVALDSEGKPLVERQCEHVLYETANVKVVYFGQIDVILRNVNTGLLIVADHKTTASLGKEFYDRCKPNPQYTGYVWLAQKALNLDTKLFMINGIQTAKTKTEFARQVTERTAEDFEELHFSVRQAVDTWLRADASLKTGASLEQSYPMTSPNPCSMYGGCQYRVICELPRTMRENAIKMEYP